MLSCFELLGYCKRIVAHPFPTSACDYTIRSHFALRSHILFYMEVKHETLLVQQANIAFPRQYLTKDINLVYHIKFFFLTWHHCSTRLQNNAIFLRNDSVLSHFQLAHMMILICNENCFKGQVERNVISFP